MKKLATASAIFGTLLLAVACNKKPDFKYHYYTPEESQVLEQHLNLPELPDDYTINLPTHLSNVGLFARPVERDKAVLGRVLFYDKNLSKDGKISCASCHDQAIGFSDDAAVSKGVYDREGDRNSIALSSVANFSAYYGTDINGSGAIRFFWDNRAETAADQNQNSLTNPKEMDMHMGEVAEMVRSLEYYEPLFKKAYGDNAVTEARVSDAIANFVNALGSYQSKFDAAANQSQGSFTGGVFGSNVSFLNDFPSFTPSENRGKSLYNTNCASCHSGNMGRPVLFNANNGLDLESADPGVGAVTNVESERGTFKVPTLRNIALTGPYMHDGRFSTIEEVLEHYSTGVQNHPNLHPDLLDGNQPKRMNFSASEKQDLIAFLNTLTDEKAIVEARFSNPFKQ
jgi:cytochrome c peroxidase